LGGVFGYNKRVAASIFFGNSKKPSLGVVATGWDGKSCPINPRHQTAEPQAQSRAWVRNRPALVAPSLVMLPH
jgi:hypothetical protein